MRTTSIALLFASSLLPLAVVACDAPAAGAREGRKETASSVINGTESSSPADEAVVLLSMDGGGFCTGTLIAPNLVLTARHCVSEPGEGAECAPFGADNAPSSIGVALGEHPSSAAAVAKGKQFFVEPNATICGKDIALILLDKDVPNITPKKVRLTPPVVGELTTAIGYGQDENEQITGRKLRSGIAVEAVGPAQRDAQGVAVNVPANDFMTGESVCHGDSGGPLFDAQGAILGTTSRGTALGCVGAPALFSSNAGHAELIKTALAASGHPLTTTTTVDAGAPTTDAGTTLPATDAGTTAPDKATEAPGSEETKADTAENDPAADDEEEKEDTKTTKPKPKAKPKKTDSEAKTAPQNGYGCSSTPGSLASGSMVPFLIALGALVARRRRAAER